MSAVRIPMLWIWVLIAATALGQSPTDAKPAPPTLADLGLSYSLSADWVLATTLMRKHAAELDPSDHSVVLSAVYVPMNGKLSQTSPFFSLLALHHAHPDCAVFLDQMAQQLEKQDKTQVKHAKQAFSVGSKDFSRLDFEQKGVLSHRSLICTTAKDYVLVWNAGARDGKGIEAVISSLSSVSTTDSVAGPGAPSAPGASDPRDPQESAEHVPIHVASGVSGGLLVKKVPPVYPADARAAYIEGTVILKAEISKEGDIVNLELLDGPLELAGSAVDAVRRWKYRPYMLNGEPVRVQTQIQVNYQLR